MSLYSRSENVSVFYIIQIKHTFWIYAIGAVGLLCTTLPSASLVQHTHANPLKCIWGQEHSDAEPNADTHAALRYSVCVFLRGPKTPGTSVPRGYRVPSHTHTHPSECPPRCYATHETGWICKNTCCRAWTTTARFTLILHSHTHYKCEMVWRIGLSNICTVTRSAVWRFTSVSSALMHRVKSITIIITIISTSPRL